LSRTGFFDTRRHPRLRGFYDEAGARSSGSPRKGERLELLRALKISYDPPAADALKGHRDEEMLERACAHGRRPGERDIVRGPDAARTMCEFTDIDESAVSLCGSGRDSTRKCGRGRRSPPIP
jgi:hypothetical protein